MVSKPLALATVVFAMSASPAFLAQEELGTLEVRLTAAGRACAGAHAYVLRLGNGVIANDAPKHVTTDSGGAARISLAPGSYAPSTQATFVPRIFQAVVVAGGVARVELTTGPAGCAEAQLMMAPIDDGTSATFDTDLIPVLGAVRAVLREDGIEGTGASYPTQLPRDTEVFFASTRVSGSQPGVFTPGGPVIRVVSRREGNRTIGRVITGQVVGDLLTVDEHWRAALLERVRAAIR